MISEGIPATGLNEVLYAALYMASTRTQIYLTAEQRRKLESRRRRERRSLASLVRDALDAYLAEGAENTEEVLEETFGSLPSLRVPSRREWTRG